jgi:hypothetical protein
VQREDRRQDYPKRLEVRVRCVDPLARIPTTTGASQLNGSFAGDLEAAGPGFEPGLSDSESEFLFSGTYRSVREFGLNKPHSRCPYRRLIRQVPSYTVLVGVGLVSNGRLCDARTVPFVLRVSCCNLQGGVRQQAQGDLAVPGVPPAHLVLVQPHLVLCSLEALLGRPALTDH